MSSSNVIRNGEHAQFNIRSFDPEALALYESEAAPPAATEPGALVLPGGPPGEATEAEDNKEEDEDLQDKAARLEREAYEKGFEQGRKDGKALEKKQLDEQRNQMEALFSEIRGLKPSLFRETEQQVINICTMIAGRIVREEIRTDPAVIQRTIRAALGYVADRSRIKIALHPEDMEEIRGILPELASAADAEFQVIEDKTLDRGGCTMETGFGKINATIKEQLSVIEDVIEGAFRQVRDQKN